MRAVGLALGWLVVLFATMRLATTLKNSRYELYDFAQEWTSAKNYWTGAPIYESMEQSLPRYFPRVKVHGIKYNAHPPFSVLLCLPLGAMPYQQAYLAWGAVSFALAVLAIGMIGRASGLNMSRVDLCWLTLLLATSNAMEQQLYQGQWNCVLLCLLCAAWRELRRERWIASAAWIGAAGAVKLVPVFLLVYFVARREWRATLVGVAVFAALNGLTAAILGVQAYVDYFGSVVHEVAKFRDTWPNASFMGYWCKLFDGGYGHVVPLASLPTLAKGLAVACSLVVLVDVLRVCAGSTDTTSRELAFGRAIVAMLLVSPITWDHYFVMLALPLAIFWRHARSPRFKFALAANAWLLVTLSPRTFWTWTVAGFAQRGEVAELATPANVLTWIAYQCYLLVALYLLAAWLGRRVAPSTSPTATASLASGGK